MAIKVLLTSSGLLAGVIAALFGLLFIESPVLFPGQKYVILKIDSLFDLFQPFDQALPWMIASGGAFEPVSPTVKGVSMEVLRGSIPNDAEGVYLRVGPNAQIWPPTKRSHVFDGDGMVHSIRMSGGGAVYHCSYVETPRYLFEKQIPEWNVRIGEMHGWVGLVKIMFMSVKLAMSGLSGDPLSHKNIGSTANTAVGMTPDNRVWALNEGGAPFRINIEPDGSTTSIGFDLLNGTLDNAMSAHPKYDLYTRETFFQGKALATGRFSVGRILDGQVVESCDLQMEPGFNHDMFVTKDYVVVIEGALRFDPMNILAEKPLWSFNPNAPLRFGVYPRGAGRLSPEAFIWVNVTGPPAEIIHVMHAENEGSFIKLWCPVAYHDPNSAQDVVGELGVLTMHHITIDVELRTATMQPTGQEALPTDFPVTRHGCVGRRCRWGFSSQMSLSNADGFNLTALLKWNLQENRLAGQIRLPPNTVCGESIFIPRRDSSNGDSLSDFSDDGYLGTFVWDFKRRRSTFVLYDARTFSTEPVLELTVPGRRVPQGFHGWWVEEADLQLHLASRHKH